MLRATTACTFSTSQLPKVVRGCSVLYILTSKCASRHNGVHFFDISTSKSGPLLSVLSILTWKCASRHNGVHFFMSHLASWLRTRRFSEPTFRPSGATNHWINTVNRDFPIFSFFCGRRPLPFGGSHLRLPSGPAGIRTTTGSLSALARPTPYQLSHRVACDFPIFSRIYLFFLLILSPLTLLTSAFQLSILSEVSLLNFLRLYG